MNSITTVFVLSLICSVGFAKNTTSCSDKAHFPEITKGKLREVATSSTATIFDVNSKKTFDKNHVPNAIHFKTLKSQADFTKVFAKALPAKKDALIVAYCGGPRCGAWHEAAEEACKKGYTNIKHFKGGIKGWLKKS